MLIRCCALSVAIITYINHKILLHTSPSGHLVRKWGRINVDAITSHRRWYDVILTPNARWVYFAQHSNTCSAGIHSTHALAPKLSVSNRLIGCHCIANFHFYPQTINFYSFFSKVRSFFKTVIDAWRPHSSTSSSWGIPHTIFESQSIFSTTKKNVRD